MQRNRFGSCDFQSSNWQARQSKSHVGDCDQAERLFIETTVRRRPPLPVWSVHFSKQTKPWAILDWWSLKLPWVLKEDFPIFQLERSCFQGESFGISLVCVESLADALRCFRHGSVLLTFGCFHTPTNAHKIKQIITTVDYRKMTFFFQTRLRLLPS